MSLFQIINEGANALQITDEMYRQARGNSMHFVAEMPVDRFLEVATRNEEILNQIKQECKTVDDYNKYADSGDSILMPFLFVDVDAKKITGHEGRHRAAALLCAGAKTIPVSFKLKPSAAMKEKYGVFDAKYDATFEDMPRTVGGEYGRGIISKSILKLLKDGNKNIR